MVSLGPILVISMPLLIVNLTNMAYGQASIWMVGNFSTEEEVAFFGAAHRLAAFVSAPLLVISAVIPPMIAELFANGSTQRLETLLRISSSISVLPAGTLLIVFFLIGEEVLGLIYGDYYRQAYQLLVILGSAQFVFVLTGPAALALAMTKHQNSLMFITPASMIALLLLGVWGGREYGAVGVASVCLFDRDQRRSFHDHDQMDRSPREVR